MDVRRVVIDRVKHSFAGDVLDAVETLRPQAGGVEFRPEPVLVGVEGGGRAEAFAGGGDDVGTRPGVFRVAELEAHRAGVEQAFPAHAVVEAARCQLRLRAEHGGGEHLLPRRRFVRAGGQTGEAQDGGGARQRVHGGKMRKFRRISTREITGGRRDSLLDLVWSVLASV